MSSTEETVYSLESDKPVRQPLDLMTALRTPYRIDILQTTYFIIKQFEDIYSIMDSNIIKHIHDTIDWVIIKQTFRRKMKLYFLETNTTANCSLARLTL